MEPLELSLSFLISYIAGNVPSLKDLLEINTSLEEKLEKCFEKAVDDWNVDPETKMSVAGNMPKYLLHLKDYLSHAPKGRHPKENELLKLWADYIISDADCSAFILQYQHEIMQMDIHRGFQRADEILSDLQTAMDEEFKRVEEKLDKILRRGVTPCSDYWERYATINLEKRLPLSIILCGRDETVKIITEACGKPGIVNIKAQTQKEALAFACAAVISIGDEKYRNAYVVEDADAYQELINVERPLVIITSLLENHYIAARHKHTVICCTSYHNRLQDAHKLAELDREGFVNALTEAGFDEAKSRMLARDSARDINNLWRALSIVKTSPIWEDSKHVRLLIPAMLLGEWNELVQNDKDIVAKMAKQSYESYLQELHTILNSEESPFCRIGRIWKVRSPYNLLQRYFRDITDDDIKLFLDCVDWLIEDDDPDAVAKMDADALKAWKDKHAFSGNLRNGVYQGLTLLTLLQEENGCSTELVCNYIKTKLDTFGLERYLSNRNYMQFVAEAAPAVFIEYIQTNMKEDSNLLKEIFEVRTRKYDVVGSSIYYSDLLFCLESLAWDERFLPHVTDSLLFLCKYPNNSNWVNKPINSLSEIFRFRLPQTYATFEQRVEILKNLADKYPEEVRALCLKLLNNISSSVFQNSSHFRWRWTDRQFTPKYVEPIPAERVQTVVDLMLSTAKWTIEEICEYLELSSHDFMRYSRESILNAIAHHKELMKGNDQVIEALRKDINRHRSCRKAKWALSEGELKVYTELLSEIEHKDLLQKNKHVFDEVLLSDLEYDDNDYQKKHEQALAYRVSIIEEIISCNGIAGVFELSRIVKQPATVAESLIKLSQEDYTARIYEEHVKGELPTEFVRSYFLHLYFSIGKEQYVDVLNELIGINGNKISVVLYSPEFKPELAEVADKIGGEVAIDYWKNVTLWNLSETDVPLMLMRMRTVGRYNEVLRLMSYGNLTQAFSSEDKIQFVIDMYRSGHIEEMIRSAHSVAEVLKSIDLPLDEERRNTILLIEFVMYDHLRHYLPGESLHFIKELKVSPELMIELVDLQYLPDEEFRLKDDKDTENGNKAALAHLAFNVWFHNHSVPGSNREGKIDYAVLNSYIDRLYELAKEHHRVHVISLVVGRIIGDIPEDESYPSDEMCELIERLADDNIDNEISCAISNRRGMSSRSPFEGGTIERRHVETLNKYRERALGKSPRMFKILSKEISSFEYMAKREDEMAEMSKLRC